MKRICFQLTLTTKTLDIYVQQATYFKQRQFHFRRVYKNGQMTIAVHLVFTFKQGNQTAKAISRIYVRLLGIHQTKAALFQICL